MVTPTSILNGPRWTYRALTSAAFIGAFLVSSHEFPVCPATTRPGLEHFASWRRQQEHRSASHHDESAAIVTRRCEGWKHGNKGPARSGAGCADCGSSVTLGAHEIQECNRRMTALAKSDPEGGVVMASAKSFIQLGDARDTWSTTRCLLGNASPARA